MLISTEGLWSKIGLSLAGELMSFHEPNVLGIPFYLDGYQTSVAAMLLLPPSRTEAMRIQSFLPHAPEHRNRAHLVSEKMQCLSACHLKGSGLLKQRPEGDLGVSCLRSPVWKRRKTGRAADW